MNPVGVTFPGVLHAESGSYTRGLGITPGTGRIEFSPQPNPPAKVGTFTLSDGVRTFVCPDCVLDNASLVRDGSGYVVQATVVDRRWRWRFGEIYGRYNTRDDDNEIIADTKKTPAELAKLLLEAMGEPDVDTSALPEEPFPEVDWDGEVPAEELAELLDDWGCVIGLDLYGKCAIWKRGEGAEAPAGPKEREGGELDPPEPPDDIRVNFAATQVQARLELEAVGRDTDGSIKPIDDLSYAPEAGWDTYDTTALEVDDETALEYCINTVFRWYRIKLPEGGLTIPNVVGSEAAIDDIGQILPLIDELVETYTDPQDGEKKPKPAKVYGTYYLGLANDNPYGNPANSTRDNQWEVKVGFRVLPSLGMIVFSKPMRKVQDEENGLTSPLPAAELFVDISFGVAHPETRAYHRWSYKLPTGSKMGTGPEVVSAKGEGGLKVYQKRESPNKDDFTWEYASKGSPDYLNQKGEKYASEALRKWKVERGETFTYSGIIPVPHDGVNVQFMYSVGPDGASTQLSRNRESAVLAETYNQRRAKERQRREANRAKRRSSGVMLRSFGRSRRGHEGER